MRSGLVRSTRKVPRRSLEDRSCLGMALTESATHGLSFGEQCEPVVQQIEAARFLISKRWIGYRHSAAHTKRPRSAEPVVKQGIDVVGRAAGVFQDKERPRCRRPEAFGWMTKECHPWAATGVGPSSKPPLHQQSHSTGIVAGVDILWHASAHKGSPLFHRRAPGPNTVDPEESPGGSRGKAPGDSSE
jgi:hypothetical protein